jgi:hypothetical protein
MSANVETNLLHKLEALARAPGTPGEGVAARAAIDRIIARAPQPTTIIGLRLRLDRACDRRKPCCDRHGIVGPGAGPHRYSLRCAQCGAHRGWVKSAAADLMETMRADGRLSSPAKQWNRSQASRNSGAARS